MLLDLAERVAQGHEIRIELRAVGQGVQYELALLPDCLVLVRRHDASLPERII